MGSTSQGTSSANPSTTELDAPTGTRRSSTTIGDVSASESTPEDMEEKTPAPPPTAPQDAPHRFSKARKKWLLILVSCAGLFSPLASSIYFPSTKAISNDLHVTTNQVHLSITIFMVLQGIAPSFWAPLADARGRRITMIGTLSVFLVSNLFLAFTKHYAALMVWRALQAMGSAATIPIGSGVINDITSRAELGGFIGLFSGLRQLGQALGPVLGAILTQWLSWHSVFWALLIMGSIVLLAVILWLPETLHSIAGDGSVPLHGIHKPLWYSIKGQPHVDEKYEHNLELKPVNMMKLVLEPVKMLGQKDVLLALLFGAGPYAIHAMVTASTTKIFKDTFKMTQLQVAAGFLGNGAGIILGSITTGQAMDWFWELYLRKYRAEHNMPEDAPLKAKALKDFPLEHARLQTTVFVTPVFIGAVCGYGYAVAAENLPAVIILQFVLSFGAMSVLAANSTLMIDMFPQAAASAIAVNNLVRCLIGASGVAIVQIAIDGMGVGPAFLMFGGIMALMMPLLALSWYRGSVWRGRRMEREQAKEEEEQRRMQSPA